MSIAVRVHYDVELYALAGFLVSTLLVFPRPILVGRLGTVGTEGTLGTGTLGTL